MNQKQIRKTKKNVIDLGVKWQTEMLPNVTLKGVQCSKKIFNLTQIRILDYFCNVNPLLDRKKLLVDINTVLFETGAAITGGFVLKCIKKFNDNKSDIDVFVNPAHFDRVNAFFNTIFAPTRVIKYDVSPPYEKVSLLSAIKYEKISGDKTYNMDVCKVFGTSPDEIVLGFDLTICMNYYNGRSVCSIFPDHVKEKKGFIAPYHARLLLKGDSYIVGRIRKYMKRGYTFYYYDTKKKMIQEITSEFLQHLPVAKKTVKITETVILSS